MTKRKIQLPGMEHVCGLPPYPIDMSKLLTSWQFTLDDAGVPFQVHPAGYHPTIIGQFALANWNQYLATNDDYYRNVFLTQANWLVQHEAHICNGAGGWPISSPHPDVPTKGLWLSALAQGNAISVLIRAFQLTGEAEFLEAAHRAIQTFKQDILDFGISDPVGDEGIFFEEVAVYPATHRLNGFIFGLLGLYDYAELTGDSKVESLIHQSHGTLHDFLCEFDLGYWTCSDLLHRHLSSHSELALQASLLGALAKYSGCEHCSTFALRWKNYQYRFWSRLHHLVARCYTYLSRVLWDRIRAVLFNTKDFHSEGFSQDFLRVCVPITGFPVTGGMRSVLAKIEQVTKDIWQIEYLTQISGPNTEKYVIHRFGTRRTGSWQFPVVWLYVFAGFWKLVSLLRHGSCYDVILIQDGIFTAAFGALVARMAGIRCVCIDHGNLSVLTSPAFRAERIKALKTKNWRWPRRLLARLQYMGYWPSLSILARFAARCVDHYFIPGVNGDGVEEVCKSLGVNSSRITRFANMIETERHVIPDTTLRAETREKYNIAADAIVIAIICRFAPEKGLEIAFEAIHRALTSLAPEICKRVRVIIAGDGPLRKQIEEDISSYGLSQTCLLWGEATIDEVITILGISDIFLFTSWRAAGYPLVVLEAMASKCAVIASTESMATQMMLAEGRGITLDVGDVEGVGRALIRLISNSELCRQMGSLARNYVEVEHNADSFRRSLLRVTYWSGLDEILDNRDKK
jgi:glycosyltransferase involved in cell wall biosynthesis